MGGIGSGRRSRIGSKNTTSDYRALDVRKLSRDNLLIAGYKFGWSWYRRGEKAGSITISVKSDRIELEYLTKSYSEAEWKEQNYPVYLSWTACHLGGRRPWFHCPRIGCGRRVAILYGSDVYICRHCRNLAYDSQREKDYDRLARRADKIRERLGWEPGILNGSFWQKPKGMHWRTFSRLVAEHDRLVQGSLIGMATDLRIPLNTLDDWV